MKEVYVKVGKGGEVKGILSGTNFTFCFWRETKSDPCVYCGGPADTIEHIIPASKGGTRGWSNCVRACHACNQERSAKPLLVYLVERTYDSKRIDPPVATDGARTSPDGRD